MQHFPNTFAPVKAESVSNAKSIAFYYPEGPEKSNTETMCKSELLPQIGLHLLL
jgi:hypothetical protein